MGFPRILSKSNKIYTKLGDFCLSSDSSHFWIVCHTCQEELQTQDQFWKHIQDEHNFMHGIKQEHNRNASFVEAEAAASLMPFPLYRKVNELEQREASIDDDDDDTQDRKEPKDYAEMRAIDANAVEIDIKVEPQSISQPLPLLQAQPQLNMTGGTTATALYHMPLATTAASAYSTMAHTPPTSLSTSLNMSGNSAGQLPPPPTSLPVATVLLPQELHKESNSTTASASSAVSSDDGERWYICDYDTCGLRFKYQSRLELHRSVHSKERRFACDLCGASFKQSCNLSTHRKKKHFLKGSKATVQQQQQRF